MTPEFPSLRSSDRVALEIGGRRGDGISGGTVGQQMFSPQTSEDPQHRPGKGTARSSLCPLLSAPIGARVPCAGQELVLTVGMILIRFCFLLGL